MFTEAKEIEREVIDTYFENLESLIRPKERDENRFMLISDVRDAMAKDQHRLFHDAEFHTGCVICDKERAEASAR